MTNVGTVRDKAGLFHTALLEGTLPGLLRYRGQVVGDAAPAASEVFINGSEGDRFYLPTDSVIIGTLHMTGWNVTDGDDPAGEIVVFMAENDGGTVSLLPNDIDTTAVTGNPVIRYSSAVAGLVATVEADNTNKSVNVIFTPTANDTYEVAGTLTYAFISANSGGPNVYSVTN